MSPKRDPIFEELDRRIAEEDRRATLTPATHMQEASPRPASPVISVPYRQQPTRAPTKSAFGRAEESTPPWETRRATYLQQSGRTAELAIEQEQRRRRGIRANTEARMARNRINIIPVAP